MAIHPEYAKLIAIILPLERPFPHASCGKQLTRRREAWLVTPEPALPEQNDPGLHHRLRQPHAGRFRPRPPKLPHRVRARRALRALLALQAGVLERPLETHLREHAIRYIYLGDQLGGQPKDRDCYEDDKVVYAKVKEKAFYRAGLERVQAAFRRQRRVVLMCSEGKPEMCHRSKLIAPSLIELGIPVMHVNEHDTFASRMTSSPS